MASGVVFLEICILAVCFYCGIVGQALLTTNTSSEDKRKWDYVMCSGEKKLTVLTSSDHEYLESPGDHCSQKGYALVILAQRCTGMKLGPSSPKQIPDHRSSFLPFVKEMIESI